MGASKGKPSNFKGKTHSKEANEKNRKSHKGKIPWNKGKTNIELYGEDKAKLESLRLSKLHKNKSPWNKRKDRT